MVDIININLNLKRRILICCVLIMICICGCTGRNEVRDNSSENDIVSGNNNSIAADKSYGHMNLEYATQFDVEYFEDGYALITIADDSFVLIPEGMDAPEWMGQDMIAINQPLQDLYVAASSALDLFDSLGEIDKVSMTSTKYSDWSLPSIKDAIDKGDLEYVGKYSAPDYEYILSGDCNLAIESTMIYHSPAVKEQLELLGIPVMVERSSYESHPLGRMEWIKLYGLLCGCEAEAEGFFEAKVAEIENAKEKITVNNNDSVKKSVAFFYITNNGYAVVRRPGDYISKMIEMAGGNYVVKSADDDSSLSTMNMQIEAFYECASNADILIYNSTIDGGIESIEDLINKSQVLADFDAVKKGNVWCTGSNVFQKSAGAADMLIELIYIIDGTADNYSLEYFYRVD